MPVLVVPTETVPRRRRASNTAHRLLTLAIVASTCIMAVTLSCSRFDAAQYYCAVLSHVGGVVV